MNINNAKEIIKELKRTGFPLEVIAMNRLNAMGLHSTSSVKYIDEESGETRELDIEAIDTYGPHKNIEGEGFLMSHFIIQCKKISKAWIFFDNSKNQELNPFNTLSWIPKKSIFTSHFSYKIIGQDKQLLKLLNKLQNNSRICRSFVQIPTEKKKDKDYLYEAIMTTVKAKRYFEELYSRRGYSGKSLIRYFWPIIVTNDVVLYYASLKDKEKIDITHKNLKEVKFVILNFDYLKPSYDSDFQKTYTNNMIFITSEQYFDDTIKKIREINNCLYKKWDAFYKRPKI